MRILFLSHYFPPEVNAPAIRTFEHCRLWAEAGHEVHVVTCVPSHPRGVAFAGYRPRWYQREEMAGIHVHRVWTWLAENSGFGRRTLNYLSFVPTAVLRALRLGRFDVVISTSPQFFCAVAGWIATRLRRQPWIFELRDLWPESIGAVGAVRRRWLLRLLERLELTMYRSADRVVCLTRAFQDNLAERGIRREKLALVPNGVDVSEWEAIDRPSARAALGIAAEDVVVSYVGTVGMAHGVGVLLDAAARIRPAHPQVRFLIAGDGADLDELRRRLTDPALDRVQILGLVPRDQARAVLVASDIAVVLLRPSPLFRTVLPSKMFEAMAAGVPIVLGVEGEAASTLAASGGGMAVPPGDAAALAEALADLAEAPDRRRALGAAGRRFVAREFSRSVWAARYCEILAALAQLDEAATAGKEPSRGHVG